MPGALRADRPSLTKGLALARPARALAKRALIAASGGLAIVLAAAPDAFAGLGMPPIIKAPCGPGSSDLL